MPRSPKSPDEQLKSLQSKRAQLDARIQKQRALMRSREQKLQTRRDILAGQAVRAHAENDAAFAAQLNALLDAHLNKPFERELFGLTVHTPDAANSDDPKEAWNTAAKPS